MQAFKTFVVNDFNKFSKTVRSLNVTIICFLDRNGMLRQGQNSYLGLCIQALTTFSFCTI